MADILSSRLSHFPSNLLNRWIRWSLGRALTTTDPWQILSAELDEWRPGSAIFWWRDDDAASATPALRRLLDMRDRFHVPLAIAAVPARFESSLASLVAELPPVAILVHGWNHQNHAPASAPAAELGSGRGADGVQADLSRGLTLLQKACGASLLPVLVPPFSQLHPSLVGAVRNAGFEAISMTGDFVPLPLKSRNVHADISDWRTGTAADARVVIGTLVAALKLRRLGLLRQSVPLGLLTHHLAHDEATWKLTERMLAHVTAHPAVRFVPLREVFGI